MMIRLNDGEVAKLAIITHIPLAKVKHMLRLGIINESKALHALIVADCRLHYNSGKYRKRDIIEALVKEYRVSKDFVERAIYHKRRKRGPKDTRK
jgi:hypothetical protein